MTSKCETEPDNDDVTQEDQERFMKEALLMVTTFSVSLQLPFVHWHSEMQGEKALAAGETPVGCVLVLQGKIIGSGMNDTNRSMNVCLVQTPDPHVQRSCSLIIETRIGHKTCRIPRNRGSASDIPKVDFQASRSLRYCWAMRDVCFAAETV